MFKAGWVLMLLTKVTESVGSILGSLTEP